MADPCGMGVVLPPPVDGVVVPTSATGGGRAVVGAGSVGPRVAGAPIRLRSLPPLLVFPCLVISGVSVGGTSSEDEGVSLLPLEGLMNRGRAQTDGGVQAALGTRHRQARRDEQRAYNGQERQRFSDFEKAFHSEHGSITPLNRPVCRSVQCWIVYS